MKGLLDDIIAATAESAEGRAQDIHFDLVDIIEAELERKNRTQKWLAEKAGIKEPQVSKLLKMEGNPSLKTIGKLLKALDVKVEVIKKQTEVKKFRTKENIQDYVVTPKYEVTAALA